MIFIKRTIESRQTESNSSEFDTTTASINDKGIISLRNSDIFDPNRDEIIILSKSESEAIMRLFKKLRLENCELPF